jgi:hypothetical protein
VFRRVEPNCSLEAGQLLAKLLQLQQGERRRQTRAENRRIHDLNMEYLGRFPSLLYLGVID